MDNNQKYLELIQPFPKQALSKVPGSANLTSIDAQWVIERLNEVFGFDGWNTEYEVISGNIEQVVIKCRLTGDGWHRESFGGATNKKRKTGDWNMGLGDLYKSAMTSSLSKAASHIGVGNDIYKGIEDNNFGGNYKRPPAQASTSDPGAWVFPKGKYEGKSINELGDDAQKLYDWAKEKGMNKGYFADFLNNFEALKKNKNQSLTKPMVN